MRRLLTATENASALFLLLIALLTAGNVVLRDLFGVQVPDWFDGSKQLQGIALFWGIALATWRGSHICVDIVWEHLSAGRRRAMDVVATSITLAFLAPMSWMVWKKVAGSGGQVTADLGLPLQWFYAVGAVGATVAALLAALRVVALLRKRSHEDLVEMELAEFAARNAAQATAGGAHRSAAGRPGDGS
ncbi:MAG: TRAP transporter small permease [Limnobacter sp.]|nr:TRAP transporter small permease [Limnobacter sp.]